VITASILIVIVLGVLAVVGWVALLVWLMRIAAEPPVSAQVAPSGRPTLSPRQETHVEELHRGGEHTTGELADLFGVARSTVYRAIERDRTHTTRASSA
jgi:hypothetical protein